MAVIPEGFAQVNYRFSGFALPTGAEITLGLNVESFTGDPIDLGEEMRDQWVNAALNEFQTDQVTLSEVLVKFGPNSTGPSASFPASVTGNDGSETVAPNTAVLVRKVTASGGRTGRGRFFLPGVNELRIDGAGRFDGTVLGQLDDALAIFHGNLLTADLVPALLHGPDSPVALPRVITSFAPQAQVATQRRRNRR